MGGSCLSLSVQGLSLIQGKDGQGTPCCIWRGKEEGLTSSSGLGSTTSPVLDSGFPMLFQNIFFRLVGSAVEFVASIKCLDVLDYLQNSLNESLDKRTVKNVCFGKSGTGA